MMIEQTTNYFLHFLTISIPLSVAIFSVRLDISPAQTQSVGIETSIHGGIASAVGAGVWAAGLLKHYSYRFSAACKLSLCFSTKDCGSRMVMLGA